MLVLRAIIGVLGLVALIVGVLSMLTVGWLAVAGVVIGTMALAWSAMCLVRCFRKPEPPNQGT
jgi:hypothetical protein